MDDMANAASADQENLACWMVHYYEYHYLEPACFWTNECPGSDPYGHSHFPY